MSKDIATEERIDNYILGRMSDAEKAAFEQELDADDSLREEYECQREIAVAVQKAAMKDFLNLHHSNVSAGSSSTTRMHHQVGSPLRWKNVMWAFASAAALIVCIVGGAAYVSTFNSLRDAGVVAYNELSAPVSRGGDEVDAAIEKVYSLIGENECDAALALIDEARGKVKGLLRSLPGFESLDKQRESNLHAVTGTDETKPSAGTGTDETNQPSAEVTDENNHSVGAANETYQSADTEEKLYEYRMLRQKLYVLDWYEAVALMRKGKVFKARRVLTAIADSDSPFSFQASDALETAF